jgi:hypothetical protein
MLGLFKDIKVEFIAITAKAGAGKDFISENLFPLYFTLAFADYFKAGLIGKQIFTYDQIYITKEPEVRKRLQEIGTEEGRDVFGEDIWVNCLEAFAYILYKRNKIDKFIIPDCRFDNEAKWIHEIGGLVVSIESNRTRDGMNTENKNHVSEKGIDPSLIDFIFKNDECTTLEQLAGQIMGAPMNEFNKLLGACPTFAKSALWLIS